MQLSKKTQCGNWLQRGHTIFLSNSACQERDLAADPARAQGAMKATKVTTKDAACRKDTAQSQTTAMGSNPPNLHPSSSWLVYEVEEATPIIHTIHSKSSLPRSIKLAPRCSTQPFNPPIQKLAARLAARRGTQLSNPPISKLGSGAHSRPS